MLRVQGLSVGYGDSQILWDVHLHVPKGQIVCLMGRNGVGKTTLLKSVMGLLSAQAGTIIFDGHEITRVRPEQRARRQDQSLRAARDRREGEQEEPDQPREQPRAHGDERAP